SLRAPASAKPVAIKWPRWRSYSTTVPASDTAIKPPTKSSPPLAIGHFKLDDAPTLIPYHFANISCRQVPLASRPVLGSILGIHSLPHFTSCLFITAGTRENRLLRKQHLGERLLWVQ